MYSQGICGMMSKYMITLEVGVMKIPMMTERPEKRVLITTGAYWMMMLFLIPIVLLYFMYGFYENDVVLGWVQILYHAVNLVCTIFIFKDHLCDGWFVVQLNKKKLLTTVMVCATVCIVLSGVISRVAGPMLPDPNCAWAAIPSVELELFLFAGDLAATHPVFGTLSVVSAALSVSCLLYGLGFSAPCSYRPWLGYVVVILVLALHRCFFYYTVGTVDVALSMFWVQLPIHLVACMAYHYTDTIWAPIFLHGILNLVGCMQSIFWNA